VSHAPVVWPKDDSSLGQVNLGKGLGSYRSGVYITGMGRNHSQGGGRLGWFCWKEALDCLPKGVWGAWIELAGYGWLSNHG